MEGCFSLVFLPLPGASLNLKVMTTFIPSGTFILCIHSSVMTSFFRPQLTSVDLQFKSMRNMFFVTDHSSHFRRSVLVPSSSSSGRARPEVFWKHAVDQAPARLALHRALRVSEDLQRGVMRRAVVQRLARLSTRHMHISAPACAAVQVKSTESAPGQRPPIEFPREGPGRNYALNWALCTKGIAPKGEAYRNLRESELKKLNATIPEPTKSTTVYARGSHSVGAADISKAHFGRLFREVVVSLTNTPKLYVHDGAIGSSPRSDARVRTVSDSPSSALLFRSILEPAPTRQVSYQDFPFTVYIASSYSPSDVDKVGLSSKDKGAFVAIDYDRSAMILGGSAFSDVETVKKALFALTAPSILSRDALPLSARLLVQGGATVVVFAPESVIQKNAGLVKAAVSPDLGLVWSKEGVARLFASKESGAPNLYKSPSSVVLVTADSTSAVPEISKVTPEKAGALFLAGYNGDGFEPGYQAGPGSVDPIELAKGFTSLLESTNIPAFLVNASVLPENDLLNYIESTVTEKLPKSKGKKPSETAGTGQSKTARVSGSKKPE